MGEKNITGNTSDASKSADTTEKIYMKFGDRRSNIRKSGDTGKEIAEIRQIAKDLEKKEKNNN
ncbi:hypothetical protein COTS27_01321 [Spirochaetota bacterium]|nr:hypothetical protein COTS27_01321 [Spirochaetota bacterium]